jgi:hypothetical protein
MFSTSLQVNFHGGVNFKGHRYPDAETILVPGAPFDGDKRVKTGKIPQKNGFFSLPPSSSPFIILQPAFVSNPPQANPGAVLR